MSNSQIDEATLRLLEAINNREFDTMVGTVLSPEMVYKFNGEQRSVEDYLRENREFAAAFPDGRVSIVSQETRGDDIISQVTFRGTHTGQLYDVPPTGRQVTLHWTPTHRVSNGLIILHDEYVDESILAGQLGLEMEEPE